MNWGNIVDYVKTDALNVDSSETTSVSFAFVLNLSGRDTTSIFRKYNA